MTTDNRNAVIHTNTGAVLKYGFTNFLDDYDPLIHTILPLNWSASPIQNIPIYFQKIVNDFFEEMTQLEKDAVVIAGIPPQPRPKRYPNAEIDPSPGYNADDGDLYYNTLLGLDMQYDFVRGKWLSIAHANIHAERNGNTAPGAYYRGSDGLTMSNTRGFSAPYNGTVVSINYTRDNTNIATFEITASGSPIAELISNSASGFYNHLDGNFQQGTILAIRNKAGGSVTKYVSVDFEVRWRI